MNKKSRLDVVVPIYNEAGLVEEFHLQLVNVLNTLDYDCRIIYVDDGSQDSTLDELLSFVRSDERVRVVELSRNFGHQAALSAGLSAADGDLIVTMDGDGQHPPQFLPCLLAEAEKGYDIVLTHRLNQAELGWFKRWTSELFYRLINFFGSTQLEPGGADFRLMNARAVAGLLGFTEYHRFLRGIVAWMGFRTVVIPYTPEARISGVSKYSVRKMVGLAMNAIFSFSLTPLYLTLVFGLIFLVLAFSEVLYVLGFWLSGQPHQLTPGWSSLMFVILFAGGLTLSALGIIGVYIGFIFQEVKRRPVFLIRQIHDNRR